MRWAAAVKWAMVRNIQAGAKLWRVVGRRVEWGHHRWVYDLQAIPAEPARPEEWR